MNYSFFIIKIIEKPIKQYFKNDIFAIEIKGQFSQIRGKKNLKTVRLFIWGDAAHDILKNYKVNDSIIVEGYISLYRQLSENYNSPTYNEIQISARKVYSFP